MTMRLMTAAVVCLLAVAPACADLLTDPRFAVGAKFRMEQFVRRGVDCALAEAIFHKLTSLDAEPWVAEWTGLAEPLKAKARELEALGRTAEARDAYMKAATLYSIAEFPVINLKTEKKYLWPLLDSMIYAHHAADYAELAKVAPAMSLKTEGWLGKPAAPMLALNGEKDPWISPRDVLILAEAGPSPKALRLYPEGTHMGDDPGSTPMVARWLRDQLAR